MNRFSTHLSNDKTSLYRDNNTEFLLRKQIKQLKKLEKFVIWFQKKFNHDTKTILKHYKELESKYADRILKGSETKRIT
ncbi:MAG: hypothetical protein SCARUB_01707 [Candidatus Scalindua rubra]|uniref:Uncharacterized protein n=1 Tax=Candidatus Scalindua rubra TaxID=1872076 RepID=A0A1E3XBX8_9BACT|nr:MAG: hypothetical protein SCARUB_01707 [Candidatus Scalindua rubra]